MIAKRSPARKTIDILGNTWTARHLARSLISDSSSNLQVRLWNEGLTPASSTAEISQDSQPKMMLVPDFLKDHKGLGFRTLCETVYIFHRHRRRDPWTTPQETAKALDCCPEVLALLYELIYFNCYGVRLLSGKKLKSINFDWHKRYDVQNLNRYAPSTTVLAAKPSIERVWDNTLEHAGVELFYGSPMRVESVRSANGSTGVSLVMSPPYGLQEASNHVVLTTNEILPSQKIEPSPWMWKSYQCLVNRELVAAVPSFFVWIDGNHGDDFIETGLLYDGAILRGMSVPVPHSDDKMLIQIDRLTHVTTSDDSILPQNFFVGSPWYALQNQNWQSLPRQSPDDLIYNATDNEQACKKILKMSLSMLGCSSSGLDHYTISKGSNSKTTPFEV